MACGVIGMAAVEDGGVVYARTEEEVAAFEENVARVVESGGEVTKVVCWVGSDCNNESVDDVFLGRVAESVGSMLKVIDLWWCEEITDAGLVALARGCGELRLINLGGCKKITDAGLGALADGCGGLRVINLGGCKEITDKGLGALARGCGGLREIYLDGCKEITDAGLGALVRECGGLREIDLVLCKKITDAGRQLINDHIQSVRARFPDPS